VGTNSSQIRTAFAGHSIYPPTLSVSISGPSSLDKYEQGTWTANVSGGVPPYSYQWYYRYPEYLPLEKDEAREKVLGDDAVAKRPPRGVWLTVGTNSSQLTRSDIESFELKCVVTDSINTQVTSSIKYVSVYANES
jgi:hypothetical protein